MHVTKFKELLPQAHFSARAACSYLLGAIPLRMHITTLYTSDQVKGLVQEITFLFPLPISLIDVSLEVITCILCCVTFFICNIT